MGWKEDTEYVTDNIVDVKERNDEFELILDDGWHLCCPKPIDGYTPKTGDKAKLFGKGLGYEVRGIVIYDRNVPHFCRYESKADMEHRYERDLEKMKRLDDVRNKFEASREANTKLHRRCHQLEHELATEKRRHESAWKVFDAATKRADYYGNRFRDLFNTEHAATYRYCWLCTNKLRIKFWLKRLFRRW